MATQFVDCNDSVPALIGIKWNSAGDEDAGGANANATFKSITRLH